MKLWKLSKCPERHIEVDAKTLKKRLSLIVQQGNIEIIQLAIQSMLEELNEQEMS